jgi:hypothetical protein
MNSTARLHFHHAAEHDSADGEALERFAQCVSPGWLRGPPGGRGQVRACDEDTGEESSSSTVCFSEGVRDYECVEQQELGSEDDSEYPPSSTINSSDGVPSCITQSESSTTLRSGTSSDDDSEGSARSERMPTSRSGPAHRNESPEVRVQPSPTPPSPWSITQLTANTRAMHVVAGTDAGK